MAHYILQFMIPHLHMMLSNVHVLILLSLKSGAKHGYTIMKHLEEHLGGDWKPASGTIYPALKKLEKKKLIHSKLNSTPHGQIRKTYFLTKEGRKTVDILLKNTKKVQKIFEKIATTT